MLKDRPSLVQQVVDYLMEKISNGDYEKEYGGRLPSEKDLGNEIGVSRTTIRDAIAQLSAQGLVLRRPGIGTFINRPLHGSLREWPYEKSSFLQLIRKTGHEPSEKVMFCGVHKDARWAEFLSIDKGDTLFAIEKVLFSDGEPVIHTWNVLPLSLVDEKFISELSKGYPCEESVYTFLKEKCHREVAYHDSDISATNCPKSLCEVLDLTHKTPILRLAETGYDQNSKPLFYGISFLRSDKISFHIRRGLSLDL